MLAHDEALRLARNNHDGELMQRLAAPLWSFWAARGDITGGRLALEEVLALTDERPARVLLGACTLRLLSGQTDGIVQDAEEALAAAEKLGDDFSLAQAWNLLGRIRGSLRGEFAEAEPAWTKALAYAELGGFAAERAESIGWLLIAAIFGPLPAEEGIARCKEFLRVAGEDPTIRAWCCVERSVLGVKAFARRRIEGATRSGVGSRSGRRTRSRSRS
jgi:hypothetical protein